MRKIIYLIDQPLDERNFDRFGIQKWVDRGWRAEVWDLTPLSHPDVWRAFIESPRKLKDFEGYFPIHSKGALRERYGALGPLEYFIDLSGENYRSFTVNRFLVRRGAVRVICAPGSIPVPQARAGIPLVSAIRKAVARGPMRTIKALGAGIARRLALPLIRPGLAIVSGEILSPAVMQSREILRVHSFDYDIYLQLAKVSNPPEREYAVFIDQDLCFHSDFIHQKVPFVVTPEKYFPAICNALNCISRCLQVEIVIAAHPRSSYEQRRLDCYPGFSIERGRTAELIGRSALVICHDSTAIHFAVLFGKPMVFVTTDELIPTYEGRSIAQAAAEFGKIPVNLDEDLQRVDWREQTSVDAAKYAEYKNRFIKTDGSPERPLWDVVIDHLERSTHPVSSRFREHLAPAGGGE
jgi:hypothetical protein